eukprot:scaffold11597_cov20-Tisochrysis_lutea.AAC.2
MQCDMVLAPHVPCCSPTSAAGLAWCAAPTTPSSGCRVTMPEMWWSSAWRTLGCRCANPATGTRHFAAASASSPVLVLSNAKSSTGEGKVTPCMS